MKVDYNMSDKQSLFVRYYGTHAVAAMVQALRSDPGSLGLVTGVGWYMTRHSVGIYGTEPGVTPGPPPASDLPGGTQLEAASGFAWAGPQAAVASLPQVSPDAMYPSPW